MTARHKNSSYEEPQQVEGFAGEGTPTGPASEAEGENTASDMPAGTESAGGEELSPEARLEAEIADWKEKFLRAKAEQQNVLRRAENEKTDAIRFANRDILRSLLDVVDDFERTLEAAGGNEAAEPVLEGVRLIQGKLSKVLTDNGVAPIKAAGQPFDPNCHEAMMRQPTDECEPGMVLQEVQKGYMLRDRVLRATKVIVSAEPPEK
jgi:molecular chaperone GrpE